MLPLIAAGLGSAAGGLLGSLFGGDEPTYKAPVLDQNTAVNEQALQKRAGRSQSDFAGIETQGIDGAKGLIGSNEMGGYGSADALGGTSPHEMQGALQARGQKLYGDDVANLSRQAQVNAVGDKFAAQKAARGVADRHTNITNAIKNQVEAQDLAHSEARNKVFSDLFGGAGNLIGKGLASKQDVQSQGRTGTPNAGGGLD